MSSYPKNTKLSDTEDMIYVVFGSERVNSDLTSHSQRGHTEMGPRFKVSSEGPEKRGSILRSLDWQSSVLSTSLPPLLYFVLGLHVKSLVKIQHDFCTTSPFTTENEYEVKKKYLILYSFHF